MGVATYGTQEFLYSFGLSSIGFSQLPVNTKNYGQVVLRIDSRDPLPVDTDQDDVDDNKVSSTAKIFMIYAKLCTVYTVLMFIPWPSMYIIAKVKMANIYL